MPSESRIEYVSIPPDGGWGWFIVLAAFLSNVVVDGTIFTFGIFLEEFCEDFNVQASLISTASSIQTGVYFILGPLVCAMINRLGFRVVGVVGGLLAFAGVLGSAFVTNVYLFISVYGVLLGLAFSMTYLANILVVGFYFEKWRPLATCISVTGTSVGISIFPPIFNILLKDYHWRMKYKFLSGGLLFVALLGFVFKPLIPTEIVIEGDDKSIAEEELVTKTKNTEYPTYADVTVNQPYTILSPTRSESKLSFKSIKSFKSTKTNRSWKYSISMLGSIPEYEAVQGKQRKCLNCRYRCCPCLWHPHRPMYRDDIMYHGSVRSLPMAKVPSMDYHMAVTRTSSIADLAENADCCNCCPSSVRRVLATMLDVSLLKSMAFMLLAFSGFVTYLGVFTPYIYGVALSESFGIENDKASFVLSVIGISNGVGRIGSGLITLIPRVDAMLLTQITLFFAGVSLLVFPVFDRYWLHVLCAAIYGFNIATISSLRTIICVDMLGLEKLTNAFGLVVLFEGIASLISLPLNVVLYEQTRTFITPFCYSGAAICLSALVLLPVYRVARYEKTKALRKERKRREKKLAPSMGAKTTSGPSTSVNRK